MIEKSVKDAEERNKKFGAEKLKIIGENSSNSEDKKRKDCNEEQYFIKFKGPKTIKKYDVKNFFAPAKIKDIEIPWRGKRLNPSYIDVEFVSKNDQVIGMAKNDRFLLKTKVHLIPYEKTPELEKNKDFSDQSLSNDTPVENGKLFFRNLPFTCSVQEVRDLFEKFGSLSDFSIKTYDAEDSRTLNRGFGSCTFVFNDDAIKALKSLDGSCFQGRIFHVLAGKQSDQNYDFVRDEEINPNNFKAIKDKKLKDTASRNIGNWNTFFFTPDTVANILESKFGIRKEELLNPTQKDLPVTIALAETKIIEETRTYLESHDIILDSFANNSSQRSDTIILIKNLPISYDYKDIKDTFYLTDDSIKRLVKAPSSSTCVVEFRDNRKSQFFMKKFAYYKIKSNVIYLEWAPITTFTKDKKRNLDETTDKTTIIVKNLPFQAQRDELHQLFSSFGNIESIRLPLKSFVSSKNPIQTHKGFAFVQFTSNLDAQKAFNSLSISTHLYGRRLVLEYASDDTQYDQNLLVESARKKTKMISDQYSNDFKKALINDVIESREA
ncbi:MAG: putative RNA-binding protein 19 [Marteilia pararefringens]